MMLKPKKKILPILVSTIVLVMLAMPRTRAQDTKNAKVSPFLNKAMHPRSAIMRQ
jgi:hypothetical protein